MQPIRVTCEKFEAMMEHEVFGGDTEVLQLLEGVIRLGKHGSRYRISPEQFRAILAAGIYAADEVALEDGQLVAGDRRRACTE
jgi:hypothetical protein